MSGCQEATPWRHKPVSTAIRMRRNGIINHHPTVKPQLNIHRPKPSADRELIISLQTREPSSLHPTSAIYFAAASQLRGSEKF